MNAGFFHARKSRAWQTIENYRWTGGPQQTSIAVKRRKTCVETRARTLGRELPNDMRASMAELHRLSTEIFIRPRQLRGAAGNSKTNPSCSDIRWLFV
jgi:hypothetical protein